MEHCIMVSSQSTTGSNGEKEWSSWNCVLAVEEVSRKEYLLSNKDMWDKGCRGAKKKKKKKKSWS